MSEGLVRCNVRLSKDGQRAIAAADGRAAVPGSRLLQAMAVSRKYSNVFAEQIPAVVPMLRSWADAPARIACESTDIISLHGRMVREI